MQDDFTEYMDKLSPDKNKGYLEKGKADYVHLSTDSTIKFNLLTKPNDESNIKKVESAIYLTCISPTDRTYNFILDQYEIIGGEHLPTNSDELTLVVDKYNRIDLYALDQMGFDTSGDSIKFSDILNKKEYRIVDNNDFYSLEKPDRLAESPAVHQGLS